MHAVGLHGVDLVGSGFELCLLAGVSPRVRTEFEQRRLTNQLRAVAGTVVLPASGGMMDATEAPGLSPPKTDPCLLSQGECHGFRVKGDESRFLA